MGSEMWYVFDFPENCCNRRSKRIEAVRFTDIIWRRADMTAWLRKRSFIFEVLRASS